MGMNMKLQKNSAADSGIQPCETQTVSCKVIQTLGNGIIGIDFMGYGIQIKSGNKHNVGDMIAVTASGRIGSKDFKCKVR